MPLKSCYCGVVIYEPQQTRCAAHRATSLNPGSRSPNRDKQAQARFRRAVLKRDGNQCTFIDPTTGARCHITVDLRACHVISLAIGGTYALANGRTLCAEHDRQTDPYAR